MVKTGVKKGLVKTLIDAFVIIIQVSYGASMLKVWLLDPFTTLWDISITILMFVIYLFRVKNKFTVLISKGFFLPKFLLFICVIDIFQLVVFIGDVTFAFSRGLFLLNIFMFMDYLMFINNEQLSSTNTLSSRITGPYEVYAYYNIVVVILCAVLIMSNVLSPTDNPVAENSLIKGNMQNGETYYFPGYLSMSLGSFRLLSFLGIPILTGLSHEPHVLWWIIGPCFFLLLDRFKEKKWLTIVFILVFLILAIVATSMTALLVFGATLILEFFYNAFVGKQKKGTLVVYIIAFAVFAIVLSKNEFLVDAISLFTEEKVNDDGSMGYSAAGLGYLFSPKFLLGWGNVTTLGWGYDLQKADIGFLTFFFDLVLFITLYINAFKLFLSKEYHIHYIGLACLYFLLHSLKLGTQVFTFPYFAYIIVLLAITSKYYNSQLINNK